MALQGAGGTGGCTDTACVSHCSTIMGAAGAESEGSAESTSQAGGKAAGGLDAGDPGRGEAEGHVRAPSLGVEMREEADDTDRGESEPSQCLVFWWSKAECFWPQGLPLANGTGQT